MKACFVCSKICLFVLNFLFVIIGLLILAQGIWVVVDSRSYFETLAFFTKMDSSVLELYANTTFAIACGGVLIVIGSLMFLLNVIGCWGLVSENRGLLITYATFMSFIFVISIIGIILLFALRGVWEPAMTEAVTKLFSENYIGTLGAHEVSEYDPFSLALDAIQITFDCCGINGPGDFNTTENSKAWNDAGRKYSIGNAVYVKDDVALPPACCKFTNKTFFNNQRYAEFQSNMQDQTCPISPPKAFNNQSCMDTIPKVIEENKVPIIVTTVIVLVLELVCIGFGVFLAVALKRWEDELYY